MFAIDELTNTLLFVPLMKIVEIDSEVWTELLLPFKLKTSV